MLHTIRRQLSAQCYLPHDGGHEAVTAGDTTLAECAARPATWGGRKVDGGRLAAHGLPPAQAHSAPHQMTAGTMQSLRVTSRLQSAKRGPPDRVGRRGGRWQVCFKRSAVSLAHSAARHMMRARGSHCKR